MLLNNSIGHNITLTGIAENAKAGAIILTENNSVVYIAGLDEWPGDLYKHEVEVKGLLQKGKLVPDPVIGKDGGISCGAYGNDYYILNAEFSIIRDK